MILTILSFILVIGVIVTIHELGHFIAARLTGMRVKRFSIGFPPQIYSRTIGQTEFAISWIPLGGYVQIAGMVDESLDGTGITGAPDEFMSKTPLQKVFVLTAGVIMNYLLAFLLLAGLTAAVGVGEINGTKVGTTIAGMPADSVGLSAGDQILAVNEKPVEKWEDVVAAIGKSGDEVVLAVNRSGELLTFNIPTRSTTQGGTERRVIGISPEITYRSATLWEAVSNAALFCYKTTAGILGFLRGILTGDSHISDLAGPVGVARMSGDSARQGSGAFLFFIAYVSVSIGFLNLLPFPVLDGGHVLYVLIEAIIRRPIPTRTKLLIQQAGMGLLILLLIVVSYHDIVRLFTR